MKKEEIKLIATTTTSNYVVEENGIEYQSETKIQDGKVIEIKVNLLKSIDKSIDLTAGYIAREEVGNISRLQGNDRDIIAIKDGYNTAEIVANYAVIKEVISHVQ